MSVFLCVYDLQKRLRDKLFILIDVEPLAAFKGHFIKSQKEKKKERKKSETLINKNSPDSSLPLINPEHR